MNRHVIIKPVGDWDPTIISRHNIWSWWDEWIRIIDTEKMHNDHLCHEVDRFNQYHVYLKTENTVLSCLKPIIVVCSSIFHTAYVTLRYRQTWRNAVPLVYNSMNSSICGYGDTSCFVSFRSSLVSKIVTWSYFNRWSFQICSFIVGRKRMLIHSVFQSVRFAPLTGVPLITLGMWGAMAARARLLQNSTAEVTSIRHLLTFVITLPAWVPPPLQSHFPLDSRLLIVVPMTPAIETFLTALFRRSGVFSQQSIWVVLIYLKRMFNFPFNDIVVV